VVIPTYNAAAWIAETLDSVLAQSHSPAEVIVVDDGSSDRTREIVGRYAPRVRCLAQSNGGPAVARNKGIRAAAGEFVALLDADDTWTPDKLERQLAIMAGEAEVGLVFCDYAPFGASVGYARGLERGPVLREIAKRRCEPEGYVLDTPELFSYLLRDLFPWTSTLLVRRALALRAGPFYEALTHAAEDWVFCLRMSKLCRFAYVDAVLARRREHEGSLSRAGNDERQAIGALEHVKDWALQPHERAAVLSRLADALLALARHDLRGRSPRVSRPTLRRYLELLAAEPRTLHHSARPARARLYLLASYLPGALIRAGAQLRGSA
jgi:glycosyltransferase involved in cell wall biosynthesis